MRLRLLFAVCFGLFVHASASAQFRRPTETVAQTGLWSSSGDAANVSLNPAAMTELSSWSLVYQGVIAETSLVPAGHSLSFATPLPFGLALGADLAVRGTPSRYADITGAIALGARVGRGLSLGTSFRFFGPTAGLGDHVAMDVTGNWRANAVLSVGAGVRDLFGPAQRAIRGERVPLSAFAVVGLRPLSDSRLTLEGAIAGSVDSRLGVRAAAEAVVPYVGRARLVWEVDDVAEPSSRTWSAVGALIMDWDRIGAGGGVVVEDSGEVGAVLYARAEGMSRNGVPVEGRVLDVEIKSAGPRAFVSLVRLLDRARCDDRIVGVRLRPRSSGLGYALAEELRLLIGALRREGKPVMCHLEAASAPELYACGAATTTAMDPSGGVRLVGMSVEITHIAELLENLGIRADFVRIGDFKSAPEQFTHRTSTAPALLAREALLTDLFGRFTTDLAGDWRREPSDVAALVDRGPFLASEARTEGIVGHLADAEEDGELREEVFGGMYPLVEGVGTDAPSRWAGSGAIGVVVVDGDIVDGENVDVPLLGMHMSGGDTIVETIDALAANPSIRAIVLRVDSPGGSALASDRIYRAIQRARRRKPVVASLGTVAASGGYFIAAATEEIWADPATVTGSIGVFFGKVDFAGLAARIGLTVDRVERGRRASVESYFRPFTDDERTMLEGKVREWYDGFLTRVAEGRGMTREAVDAVGQGRIWSGDAALRYGLVDRLGGLSSALARARQLGGLSDDAEIVVVPRRPETLLDYVLAGGVSAEGGEHVESEGSWVPPALRALAARVYALSYYGSESPMMRLPLDIEVQ